MVTHDLLFTFPFLFRSLSLYRPLPFVPPFLVLNVSSSRQVFVSLQSLPFVSVRSCSCLTHELDLSALDVCRVGKAELPNYLWDQGPVIEFLTYGNKGVARPPMLCVAQNHRLQAHRHCCLTWIFCVKWNMRDRLLLNRKDLLTNSSINSLSLFAFPTKHAMLLIHNGRRKLPITLNEKVLLSLSTRGQDKKTWPGIDLLPNYGPGTSKRYRKPVTTGNTVIFYCEKRNFRRSSDLAEAKIYLFAVLFIFNMHSTNHFFW